MKKRKWPKILALLLVLAVAGGVAALKLSAPVETMMSNTITHTLARGDVSVTITGSGRLETDDIIDIDVPVGVEVESVFVKEGDMVAEGEILAAFDSDSLEYRAAQLSSELSTLDMQLAARRTAGEIVAPVKGRIKQISAVEDGDVIDAVNEHGSLAVLSTDGLMQIEVETGEELSLNAEVEVKWNGGAEDGAVAARTAKGYLITLDDEDAPYLAKADVFMDAEKIGSGVLEIHAPLAIFGNGGVIEEIHKDVDDVVNIGAKIFTLSSEPAVDSYRQTLSDRSEKAVQLQDILRLMADPHIVAEEAGVVTAVYVQEGEKTASADMTADAAAFSIGVGGAVMMTVDVDELDIGDVQVGQSVVVTLDAFAGETFDAEVTRVSHIGQSAGSITTYAAEICLKPDERLMIGMNGSAVIHSKTAEDALYVPLAAISEDGEGAYVQLLGEDGAYTKRYIETGLSDGTNAEVISGLSEGDQIVYRGSTNALFLMQQRMMENQAAMFGGMQE